MLLRDYQDAAIAALFGYFENGGRGNPIIALPTGTGKSVVIGEFIRQALFKYPQTRILKLTHVKELIRQNLEKLLAIWPSAPVGIYSAGLGKKDLGFPITFAGVASIAKLTPAQVGRIDLLLIDECHLVSQKENTMYRAIIFGLLELNPFLKVIGFTATKFRLGQGLLTDDGGLFTDCAFDLTKMDAFNWFIEQGYLARVVPRATNSEFNLSGVRIHGGEFQEGDLQAAVNTEEITHSVCSEMVSLGFNRAHWLVFASGIAHAERVTEKLIYFGINAKCVHSKKSKEERDATISDFEQGKFQALVNNGILTTGFDFPGLDLIGVLRATMSPGLWVQMIGRGTRPCYADGFDLTTVAGRLTAISNSAKPDCLVLDFAGNTKRLGPINDPIIPGPKNKGGSGPAPVKVCPMCMTYNHASVRVCENCGYEFPRICNIAEQASTAELIAVEKPRVIQTCQVDRVYYKTHRKLNSPPSLEVHYYSGLRVFREWVCLEHSGFPRKKAVEWWNSRSSCDAPNTVADAMVLLNSLLEPVQISVELQNGFDQVVDYYF